jgi:hypothetical protein
MPSPRKGEKRDDFISRCMGDSEAKSDFPKQDQRFAFCNSQWERRNSNAMKENHIVLLKAAPEAIRTEKFGDTDHRVIPVVALIEGVLQCATCPEPEFAPASEFGKTVEAWNGRPVTINHPKRNGQFVSANIPSVFENEVIGILFNTQLDGDKLKTEAWIDAELERAKPIIELLESGDTIEVSTGYFADIVPMPGKFNGESFSFIQSDVKPDHLAILTDSIGACSVEMGCGAPRLNCEGCDGTCNPCNELVDRKKSFTKRLKQFMRVNADLSDMDRRRALSSALDKKEPDEFFFINAVFDNFFIYERGFDSTLLKRTFTVEEDGSITLGEEVEEVRPETNFIPVKVNKKENVMSKKDKVNALIANEASQFDEKDRDWLMTFEDDHLDKLAPKVIEPEPSPEPIEAGEEDGGEGEETPQTEEEFIETAPGDMKEVLAESLQMHRQERNELIKSLLENKDCVFSEDELKGMNLGQLKKLEKLAGVEVNYGGRGGPRTVTANEDRFAPTPPQAFPLKKEAS